MPLRRGAQGDDAAGRVQRGSAVLDDGGDDLAARRRRDERVGEHVRLLASLRLGAIAFGGVRRAP